MNELIKYLNIQIIECNRLIEKYKGNPDATHTVAYETGQKHGYEIVIKKINGESDG